MCSSDLQQVAVTESGHTRAQQVNMFVDVTEVRAFLKQKSITIHESDDEPKAEPKLDKHTPEKTVPKKVDATPIKTDPPKKEVETPAGASEADEKAAADMLKRSGVFANDPDQKDYYMKRLQEITKKYPGTAAAKEAQKKLDGLK